MEHARNINLQAVGYSGDNNVIQCCKVTAAGWIYLSRHMRQPTNYIGKHKVEPTTNSNQKVYDRPCFFRITLVSHECCALLTTKLDT